MSKAIRVNATLDSALLARIDAFAEARLEDRSTAIRQLVDLALRELAKRDALTAYAQGRLTLREFGHTLGLGVWAAQDLLAAEGVAVAQGARAETRAAVDDIAQELRATEPTASGEAAGRACAG